MPSTFNQMKSDIEAGWDAVVWSESYGWGDVAAVVACAHLGCLSTYLADKYANLLQKVGEAALEQAISNKGKVLTAPGNIQVQAGTAYWSEYQRIYNPFANRHENVTTERYVRLYVRWRQTPATPLPKADAFPEPAVASGNWLSIKTGRSLVPMFDGRVLDWELASGKWRLWVYDPSDTQDVLPGNVKADGKWQTINAGHHLIKMHDGRVLDWQPSSGHWRLWNYNPSSTADIFPGAPVASGQWGSIKTGHSLIPMIDGRILDWEPANGHWRLWNYNPGSTADIFPGAPVASGQWGSIKTGHSLIPMIDGRILDWEPANGHWRLWNYSAYGH